MSEETVASLRHELAILKAAVCVADSRAGEQTAYILALEGQQADLRAALTEHCAAEEKLRSELADAQAALSEALAARHKAEEPLPTRTHIGVQHIIPITPSTSANDASSLTAMNHKERRRLKRQAAASAATGAEKVEQEAAASSS